MKKILIINLCGIGDTLFFLPTLLALRAHYPEARIDYLVSTPAAHEIVKRLHFVLNIWDMPLYGGIRGKGRESHLKGLRHYYSMLKKIRQEKYDLTLWPFCGTTLRKILFANLVGSHLNLMHRGIGWISGKSFKSGNHFLPVDFESHVVHRNLAFLDYLKIPAVLYDKINFQFSTEEEEKAARLRKKYEQNDSSHKMIAVHPGGNMDFCDARAWPTDSYADLADKLQQAGHICVFFGMSREEEILDKIRRHMKTEFRKCQDLKVGDLFATIGMFDFLLGNDSSMVHVATSMSVPSLTIHGPSNPNATGGWSLKAAMVRADLPCSPCFESGYVRRCPYCYCLTTLTSQFVFETVTHLLDESRKEKGDVLFQQPVTEKPQWSLIHELRRRFYMKRFSKIKKIDSLSG